LATSSDLENFTPEELERCTPQEIEDALAVRIAVKNPKLARRFFEFDDTDRSNLVARFGEVVREGGKVVATAGSLDLVNTTGFFSNLFNTPEDADKSVALKVGFPAKKTVFTGKGLRVEARRTLMTLFLRDKFTDLLKNAIGDEDTAVTYGQTELLTDGGLEAWDDANTLTNWDDGTEPVPILQTEGEHGGTYDCKILGDSGGDLNYIEQSGIAITGGNAYELSFWHIQDTGETNQGLKYYIKDEDGYYLQSDGSWDNSETYLTVTVGQTYARESVVFVTRADAETLTVRIRSSVATEDDCRVDDITLHDGNPACIAWNVLVVKNGLDSTVGSSNADIDYADWETWGDDCGEAELCLGCSFKGTETERILNLLAKYSHSYVYINEDGKVDFKRIKSGGSSVMSIGEDEWSEYSAPTEKKDLANDITVAYDYDGAAWAGTVTDSSTASQTTWGTFPHLVQETDIWHETQVSAESYAAKHLELYANMPSYINVTGPLCLVDLDIGDIVKLTLSELDLSDQYCRVERIRNNALVNSKVTLTLKNLATENFFFNIDSADEWEDGTIPTNMKKGDGYIILKRNAGSYFQFDTADYGHVATPSSVTYMEDKEVDNSGEDDLQIQWRMTVQIISGSQGPAEFGIQIYDEENNLLDSEDWQQAISSTPTTVTKTATLDVSGIRAGQTMRIRRWVKGNNLSFTTSYTHIKRMSYASTATYTSKHKYWEATVNYATCAVESTLNGESATVQLETSEDNFSTTEDTWGGPQALSGGEESFDVSALQSSKYVRAKFVLNSSDGGASPRVDLCQVFPS